MDIDVFSLERHQAKGSVITNCVYILFKDDVVVYVGITTSNLMSRIGSHLKDKDFDSYAYIRFDSAAELPQQEKLLVENFEPTYNINYRKTLQKEKRPQAMRKLTPEEEAEMESDRKLRNKINRMSRWQARQLD